MNYDKPPHSAPSRVREPVQVYLDPEDQARLHRLKQHLDTTKSDILRRGLEALERQLSDPAEHPALRIIGIAAGAPDASDPGYDPAREHDRFLSDAEEQSWTGRPAGRGGQGPRKKTGRGR